MGSSLVFETVIVNAVKLAEALSLSVTVMLTPAYSPESVLLGVPGERASCRVKHRPTRHMTNTKCVCIVDISICYRWREAVLFILCHSHAWRTRNNRSIIGVTDSKVKGRKACCCIRCIFYRNNNAICHTKRHHW